MKVKLSSEMNFLACRILDGDIQKMNENVYRLTFDNGFRQNLKKSEYLKIIEFNRVPTEQPKKEQVVEKDELEDKTNKELFEIVKEYYVDAKMLRKDKMIQLIREARAKQG
jgi:hypothetical protein